jgi:hypothetical protein
LAHEKRPDAGVSGGLVSQADQRLFRILWRQKRGRSLPLSERPRARTPHPVNHQQKEERL